MSVAGALARVSCVIACIGCESPTDLTMAVKPNERIAGRAVVAGTWAILTTSPALVTIDAATREVRRRPVRTTAATKVWGLGEKEDALYSIDGFRNLVRLRPSAVDVDMEIAGVLAEPLGNLVDTVEGMAGQLALDNAGRPLAWNVDAAGNLSALHSPGRSSLGLSRAEESLLHLMSCSLPPRVFCWTPGSNVLLRSAGGRIERLANISSVRPIAPAALLVRPESRSIEDAIGLPGDSIGVLFDARGAGPGSALAEFSTSGAFLRELRVPAPLRALLSADDDRIVAIARSGGLVEVRR